MCLACITCPGNIHSRHLILLCRHLILLQVTAVIHMLPTLLHLILLQVVESIFKLQEGRPTSIASDMRNALIDQLA